MLGPSRTATVGLNAVPLQVEAVAVGIGVLIEAGRANGHDVVEVPADVSGEALVVPRAELQGGFARLPPIRLPRDAVDDAAHAAAAEDHGVGALERFHAVDVVDVAEVLDVVADTIDEEVGGRAVTAQDRRVAIAFALREADPRHVPGDVRHAGHALVSDQRARDHADGLRDVAQRRSRLGRRRHGRHRIADGGPDTDRFLESGDLEGEIRRRRRTRDERDTARRLSEATGADANGVRSRQQRQFELTLQIRDGGWLVCPRDPT